MKKILFLFLFLICGISYAQTAYNESFEVFEGGLSGWTDTDGNGAADTKFLGYSCWATTTGGTNIRTDAACMNGVKCVGHSATTSGQDFISPKFNYYSGQTYTFSFWYNGINNQTSGFQVYLDEPDGIVGNFIDVSGVITNDNDIGTWIQYETSYTATSTGVAMWKIVYRNIGGGQMLLIDSLFHNPTEFNEAPCIVGLDDIFLPLTNDEFIYYKKGNMMIFEWEAYDTDVASHWEIHYSNNAVEWYLVDELPIEETNWKHLIKSGYYKIIQIDLDGSTYSSKFKYIDNNIQEEIWKSYDVLGNENPKKGFIINKSSLGRVKKTIKY